MRSSDNAATIADRIHEAAGDGLYLALEHVLGVSRDRVPHEEGTLERSGATDIDRGDLLGVITFDTPYAVAQHEDLSLAHDDGRQAKYLESAATGEASTVGDLIATSIRRELDR